MNSNYIPDGEWQGFYFYAHEKLEHKMNCTLRFKNSMIDGSGWDDVAPFSIRGKYSDLLNVEMIKSYPTHNVFYNGCADENGIWGKWKLYDGITGGFHIWPVKENSESMLKIEEKKMAISASMTKPGVKELVTIK